jgi:hypothetical protein
MPAQTPASTDQLPPLIALTYRWRNPAGRRPLPHPPNRRSTPSSSGAATHGARSSNRGDRSHSYRRDSCACVRRVLSRKQRLRVALEGIPNRRHRTGRPPRARLLLPGPFSQGIRRGLSTGRAERLGILGVLPHVPAHKRAPLTGRSSVLRNAGLKCPRVTLAPRLAENDCLRLRQDGDPAKGVDSHERMRASR